MNENSTDNASGQTVSLDCENSRRVHMIEIRAPPNTEEEGDYDCPWTDRLLSRKLDGSSSEVVYGEDGRVLYSAATGCGSDRNADIAALSDFSDDPEETGVRRLSDCQIPVTVQPILVTDDVIPIPWDQPVDHKRRPILEGGVEMSDEEMYNRRYHPIKSSMLQWDRGVLPEHNDLEFAPCIRRMVAEALARDEDPLLDNEYPELIRCMVKSFRMLRSTWDEHDARLREQGTVCTTPGCQCHRRAHIMFRKICEWNGDG